MLKKQRTRIYNINNFWKFKKEIQIRNQKKYTSWRKDKAKQQNKFVTLHIKKMNKKAAYKDAYKKGEWSLTRIR